MTPGPPLTDRRQAGFVLIGVVIFVLALTIIGISLFSLSSYEAQFLHRSLDTEQATQSAIGGLDRARFVLCETSRLESVGQDLPRENVIAATAFQVRGTDSVSTGPVEWVPDQPVHLQVTTRVGEQERTVTACFTPQEATNYYRQLFTTSGRIRVDPPESAVPLLPAFPTIDLSGPAWQGTVLSAADTAWAQIPWGNRLRSWWPGRRLLTGAVDTPDLASYFVRHAPTAALAAGYSRDPEPADVNRYSFNADPDAPTYYRVPTGFDPGQCLYDVCDGAVITISGQGCVVWELPAGVHFLNPPLIQADHGHHADDRCLVIVAGADPAEPTHAGIFFEGGLRCEVPIILVSNVGVAIQHINNPGYVSQTGFSTEVDDIAVYARDLTLRGPRSASLHNLSMELRHLTTGSLDQEWVPHLAEHDGLPNLASATGHRLALQPGTWRASTP